MNFASPLQRGRLIRRYKRFLADIVLDTGETLTAVCPNTGAMLGLCTPGTIVWVSTSAVASRKYAQTWELVELIDAGLPTFVGINTNSPNAIVAEALAGNRITELAGAAGIRREVRYGESSRIDFLLEGADGRLTYLEIKNVHLLRRPRLAEFPDCVTARGAKHLRELTRMVEAGHRAVMLYLVQREDADAFAIAADIDPTYAAEFARARAAGVEVLAYGCWLSTTAITLDAPLEIALPGSTVLASRPRNKGGRAS